MKINKRTKNSIVLTLVFNVLLFLVVVLLIIFYIVPSLSEVSADKNEANALEQEYRDIMTKGVTYDDFMLASEKIEKSTYTNEILKNLDKIFFDNTLRNNKGGDYASFLENTYGKMLSDDSEGSKNEELVNELLPSYSKIDVQGDEFISDFEFVNNLESILETFGLKYDGELGIKRLVIDEDVITQGNANKTLEKNIFYIPLDLRIEGSKKSVINFLHYIENVGKINIEDENIFAYRDSELTENGRPILLKGDSSSQGYNIYKNQVIDIENIIIKGYIDSSKEKRPLGTTLVEFIKNGQGNESVELDITLKFYVKGIPNYVVTEFISSTLMKHNKLTVAVAKELKSKKSEAEKIKYLKASNYLKDISKDIVDIQKKSKQDEDMESVYIEVYKYAEIFKQIEDKLGIKEGELPDTVIETEEVTE